MKQRDIFIEAMQKQEGEERRALLDAACGDDVELRNSVEELLAEHRKDDSFFLDAPPPGLGASVAVPAITERPGTQIGPYKIREQIGAGGFGVVFVAEQTEPVRRKVALKVIKPGMDTNDVIARFEAERQALALMDHPNVARVLDAGATESGRPYFAMELVQGVPITEFCDEQRLSTRERLELFVQVSQAVQHAHQKGIIHRDIKPSNVMVTMHDHKPVPKVIDFGVAKAIGSKLTEKTIYTAYGQMVGTPMYMSPEQAQMSGLDIDTRSDVYSLGVLLYELLTGTTPFDKETLHEAGFDEMRRIIREDDPPRPSDRVSTLNAQARTTISQQRRIDTDRLGSSLRGELDWIVMKSLEKDRGRRYESPNRLAADIERYLNGDLIEACPPTVAYRLSQLIRRHGAALSTAVVVLAALVVGAGISIWQAFEATEARKLAEENASVASSAQQRAEANLDMAMKAMNEISGALGKAVLRQDLAANAEAELTATQQELLQTSLGFYERFVELSESNETVSLTTAQAYMRIGQLQRQLDQPARKRTAYERAIAILEKLVAQRPDSPELRFQLALACRALATDEASQRSISLFERLARDFPEVGDYRFELGEGHRLLGDNASLHRAEDVFRRLVDDHPDNPEYQHARAVTLRALDRQAEAIPILEKLMRDFPRVDKHPLLLALCLADEKRFEAAIDVCQRLHSRTPETLEDRCSLMRQCYNLGLKLRTSDELMLAERVHLMALEITDYLEAKGYSARTCRAARGDNHLSLSRTLRAQGRAEEADQFLELATSEFESLIELRKNRAWFHLMLGDCYTDQGRIPKASEQYREAARLYEQRAATLPTRFNWGKVASANQALGNTHFEARQYLAAREAYLKAETASKRRGSEPPFWVTARIRWINDHKLRDE